MRNAVMAYAESFTRGKMNTMEDASVVLPNFRGNPAEFLAAIYDGHYGRTTTEIAAETLHNELGQALVQGQVQVRVSVCLSNTSRRACFKTFSQNPSGAK